MHSVSRLQVVFPDQLSGDGSCRSVEQSDADEASFEPKSDRLSVLGRNLGDGLLLIEFYYLDQGHGRSDEPDPAGLRRADNGLNVGQPMLLSLEPRQEGSGIPVPVLPIHLASQNAENVVGSRQFVVVL